MKTYIKLLSALLAFVFALSLIPTGITARFVEITAQSTDATVISVIDATGFEVRLDNGRFALVRLAGVEADGSEEAFRWLQNELLGRRVRLTVEPAIVNPDRWNRMYVHRGNVFVNARMLQEGMARVSEYISSLWRRAELVSAENFARLSNIGIWQMAYFAPPLVIRHYDRVNINTAPALFMADNLFNDVFETRAEALAFAHRFVAYRSTNLFSTVCEVKFVNGVTREIFNEIRHRISVVTDINTASRLELMSLGPMTGRLADLLLEYRSEQKIAHLITTFEWLELNRNLPRPEWTVVFTAVNQFVSTALHTAVPPALPNFVVNINTASRDRLIAAGLSFWQADIVISQRNNYFIKSLFELTHVSGLPFADAMVHSLYDNLNTITDINTATEIEIRSLFNIWGFSHEINAIMNNRPFNDLSEVRSLLSVLLPQFDEISQFVEIGGLGGTDFVNANTATVGQLMNAGYSASQAVAIHNMRGRMITPLHVPAEARYHMHRITLVTNINAASPSELASLGEFMTDRLIAEIIAYRNDQPFGSRFEIFEFFRERNLLAQYLPIEWFINVR